MRTNDAIRNDVNRELLTQAQQRQTAQSDGTRTRVLDLMSRAARIERNAGTLPTTQPGPDASVRPRQ